MKTIFAALLFTFSLSAHAQTAQIPAGNHSSAEGFVGGIDVRQSNQYAIAFTLHLVFSEEGPVCSIDEGKDEEGKTIPAVANLTSKGYRYFSESVDGCRFFLKREGDTAVINEASDACQTFCGNADLNGRRFTISQ